MYYHDYISYYDVDADSFSWFCGLFEAEGSISFAAPSASKSQVNIKISMMDKDVIENASRIVNVNAVSYRQSGYNYDMHRVHVGGIRAVEILKLMLPYLSHRRQARALDVINDFNYTVRLPLKAAVVKEIEKKLDDGCKGTDIAESYNISNSVVSQIKHQKHYVQVFGKDYQILVPKIDGKFDCMCWLAGVLDGDGTFIKRNKSQHQIGLTMKDKDVVDKVAKIMKSNVSYSETRKMYFTTKSGSNAVKIMKALLPWMGHRRSSKINEILRCEK